jgi:hypothetical protein
MTNFSFVWLVGRWSFLRYPAVDTAAWNLAQVALPKPRCRL